MAAGLPTLLGVVLIGSIVLVIPTGAAVSAAAVVAWRHAGPLSTLGVVLAGAAGAYLGDLVVYAVCRRGGAELATRLRWLRSGRASSSVARISESLFRNDVQTLVLGRLLPAGRMPVLIAAGLGGYSWRRFAVADVASVLVWSAVYTIIGVAGGSLFPETWESVLAAVLLVVLLSALARRIRHPALHDDEPVSPAVGRPGGSGPEPPRG